jgi:hypothetical protein
LPGEGKLAARAIAKQLGIKLSTNPLSIFLAAVDNFSHDELVLLRQRIEERLAAPG